MGQRDLAQNDYLNDKTRFADMCNGILFQGQDIIRPEELWEAGEDIVYLEGKKRRKIIPDKVRLWHGFYLAVISVENQTKVDYRMVFRMMKGEAVCYERQWNERESELQRLGVLGKKTRLCWYGKNEKFTPVIPIVIYYGTDKTWDGATCLYDMLDMDASLAPFVMNYKLNLFDYHECKDFSIFATENRELFELLSCARSEKKVEKMIRENAERYKELTYDAAQTICDIAGIDVTLMKEISEDGREVANMCKAWDDHKKAGIKEGIKEGIKVFIKDKIEDGVSEEKIIDKVMRGFALSEKNAKKYYKMFS